MISLYEIIQDEISDVKIDVPDRDQVVIGRSNKCEIVINYPGISKQHCAITKDNSNGKIGYKVRDLKSRNGTYVNLNRIDNDKKLEDRDVLCLGGFAFFVRIR